MACDDSAAYCMMLASTENRKVVSQIATKHHHHIPKTLNRRERQKQKKKAKGIPNLPKEATWAKLLLSRRGLTQVNPALSLSDHEWHKRAREKTEEEESSGTKNLPGKRVCGGQTLRANWGSSVEVNYTSCSYTI